jgi:CelD/BcsL family acetyltransferase involved in cellulose biosynthesis
LSGALQVDRLTTTADLQTLIPEWEALLRACPGHPLAATPLWLATWWEIYGEGRELCVLAARDGSRRLVGLAPLLLRPVRHRGMLPFRRLEFLGAGEPEAEEIGSDYLDLIVDPQWEPAATQILLTTVFTQLGEAWDEALFVSLPGQSPRRPALAQAAEAAGCKCEEADRRAGVYITLPPTWEEMLQRLPGDKRKSLLRRRRRLAEAGQVTFDWEVSPENFERRLAIVRDLHQCRWQSLGRPGCFASERFSHFHQRVAGQLAASGGVRFAVLSLDDRPVACDFYYLHDRRVYAYQAGLDPEEGPRLSAGTVGISYGIEAAIRAGCREYDFLKGVHPYKADWSPERREQVTLRIAKPGVREGLRATLETGIGWVRPLRRRLAGARNGSGPAEPAARPPAARRNE